jgi:hypothetical protein
MENKILAVIRIISHNDKEFQAKNQIR